MGGGGGSKKKVLMPQNIQKLRSCIIQKRDWNTLVCTVEKGNQRIDTRATVLVSQ